MDEERRIRGLKVQKEDRKNEERLVEWKQRRKQRKRMNEFNE